MSRLPVLTSLAALAFLGGGAGGLALARGETVEEKVRPPAAPLSEPLPAATSMLSRVVRLKPGESLTEALVEAGVGGLDAAVADEAMRTVRLETGRPLRLRLGGILPGGARRLDRLEARSADGKSHVLTRRHEQFSLSLRQIAVDDTPVRLRLVGPAVEQRLAAAGLPADVLREVKDKVRPLGAASLDLIVAHEESEGESLYGSPLYLAATTSAGEVHRWLASGEGLLEPVENQGGAPGLQRPVQGPVSSTMGLRFHPVLRFLRWHRGTDFAAPAGTPVLAAAEGVVLEAGWRGGYGRLVRLAHPDGTVTLYAHLQAISAAAGERVGRADVIGIVGSTGLATGPHLHFEWLRNGQALRPAFGHSPRTAGVADGATLARLRSLLAAPYREPPAARL